MVVYTISPDLLRSIGKEEGIYFTDILFVFSQKTNSIKAAKDKTGSIIDIYSNIENNKETIATWLHLMTCLPCTFETIDIDINDISCEETKFLKICKETKNNKKLILYTSQNLIKYQTNNNTILFENQTIEILDRDQARFELTNSNRIQLMETTENSLPTVVILTAIKEEYLAIRDHLNDISDSDKNDTTYETGFFKFNEKKIAKVIIRECGAKNTNAAQETERAINHFKPDMILFVGIAGSRKPTDFALGDVIIPEKIYSYEGGKSEKDSFLSRPDNALMSYPLLEKAKKERNKDDWKVLVKGFDSSKVKADIGIIASGEQVVEHYSSEIGEILSKHFNDTSAVEMEGFGFGRAANRQGRETNNILFGVIRGISDIIEKKSKGNKTTLDRRPTNAKKLASATAAAFGFWLILKTFEDLRK